MDRGRPPRPPCSGCSCPAGWPGRRRALWSPRPGVSPPSVPAGKTLLMQQHRGGLNPQGPEKVASGPSRTTPGQLTVPQERGQWPRLCCALMAFRPASPWAEGHASWFRGQRGLGVELGVLIPASHWAPPPGVGGASRRPHRWPVTRDGLRDQLRSRGEHPVLNPFEGPRGPRFSKEKNQEQDRGGSRAPRAPRAPRAR